MLISRLLAERPTPIWRLNRLAFSRNFRHSLLRTQTNSTTAYSKNTPKQTLYPERLIVYHAGTGRTVFLGCLKVTTIFLFSFFCIFAAPAHFYSDEGPSWVAGALVLSGVAPLLFVTYTSGPFVNYIHLRVPMFARSSHDILVRYAKSLPQHAELDITTMNFIGKPRVSRMKISELYPTTERFGLANFARDTKDMNAKRPWWMGKAPRLFGVHSNRRTIMGGEIWDHVANIISSSRRK